MADAAPESNSAEVPATNPPAHSPQHTFLYIRASKFHDHLMRGHFLTIKLT